MKIARYWALAEANTQPSDAAPLAIRCWRWSEHSQQEAQQRADQAVRQAVDRVQRGQPLGHGYGYTDRPPREEIVQELHDPKGNVHAVVTRNTYGALVLNTRDLMFIDIDVPEEPVWSRWKRGWAKWFGGKVEDPATVLRQRVARTAESLREYTLRLYTTRAGFRCAVVNRPIVPSGDECNRLLAHFEADPLYIRLCQAQQCYRARLTPKFWRVGAPRPPSRYPWRDEEQKHAYRQWQEEYQQRCRDFATCRLLDQFGSGAINGQLAPLVELHDQVTRAVVEGDTDSSAPDRLA